MTSDKVYEQLVAEIKRQTFLEIEIELQKHKINTNMSGWDIVPKIVATMQLHGHDLVSKAFLEGVDIKTLSTSTLKRAH